MISACVNNNNGAEDSGALKGQPNKIYFLVNKTGGDRNDGTHTLQLHNGICVVLSSGKPLSYSIIKRFSAIKTYTFNAGGATI